MYRRSLNRRGRQPLATALAVAALTVAATTAQTGTAWAGAAPPAAISGGYLRGVSAVSATDVWAVGDTASYPDATMSAHWNGRSWQQVSIPTTSGGNGELDGVDAVSANSVWAVGSGNLADAPAATGLTEHWNGHTWKIIPSASPGEGSGLSSVSVDTGSYMWAVGSYNEGGYVEVPFIEHWAGGKWTQVTAPVPSGPSSVLQSARLFSVSADSDSDAWAVGYYCVTSSSSGCYTLTEHWNGADWSIVPSPNVTGTVTNILQAVTAISPTDAWAVGYSDDGGLVEHWDGTSWSIVSSPRTRHSRGDKFQQLYGVSAVSANDIWAVGSTSPESTVYDTLVEHWNGTRWRVVRSPNPSGSTYSMLNGVTADSVGGLWAAGNFTSFKPLVERWNGRAWKLQQPR